MYQSKYYTCEEIDERLLKGYYDDAVSNGYSDTFEQFKLKLASIGTIEPGAQVNHTLVFDGEESDLDISDEQGNVILRLKEGHLYVQKFRSDTTLSTDNLQIRTALSDDESGNRTLELFLVGYNSEGELQEYGPYSLPYATEESEGTMSAEDKRHLEKLNTSDTQEGDLDISDDEGNVILRFSEGEIQTKKFNSRNIGNPALFDSSKTYAVGDYITYGNLFYKFTAEHTGEWNADDVEYITIMEYVKEMVSKVEHSVSITDGGDFDLDISDEQGNAIARFSGGEFQTKNFDSMKTPVQRDDNGAADFQIADEFGNVIAEFKEGNFRTKNFDSTKSTSTSSAKVVKDDQDRNILILSSGAVINGKLYL